MTLNMKKLLFSFCAIILGMTLSAAAKPVRDVITPAGDGLVTYVGRVLKNADGVSFDWSATYARVRFEGNYLAVNASDTHRDYFNVWIDKDPVAEPDKIIAIGKGSENSTFGSIEANDVYEGLITLVDEADIKAIYGKKAPSEHFITIQKRTEGEQGTTTFKSFVTRGRLLQAEPLKARQIEFVGDSFTCGYGSENSVAADPFTPETENCSKAYAAIVARYFDADYATVAHSGMGIARNYNSKFGGWYMPDRYCCTFDMNEDIKWDAKAESFSPDITVIYLGTNDFSVNLQPSERQFTTNYNRLLKQIKDNYGEDHPVLCMIANRDENLNKYIHDIVKGCGLTNVRFLDFTEGIHHNDDRNLGASSHPNYQAHTKLAYQVIPYVATMTCWELDNKVIR